MTGFPGFNIAAVERETGISKDLLRMWERRYGYPVPQRDENGERLYSMEQMERLRLYKRLMDGGMRPGRFMRLSPEQLTTLSEGSALPREFGGDTDGAALELFLLLLEQNDAVGLWQALTDSFARQGYERFVLDTLAPLSSRVGEAWERGRVTVFQEHLFTEACTRLLHQASAHLPPLKGRPVVLLATVGAEQHILGLRMVEALFSLEGASCIQLGASLPLTEVAAAAEAYGVDVVGLSFSAAFTARQVAPILSQMRSLLSAHCELWAGGAGVRRVSPIPGVRTMGLLEEGVSALREWRNMQP